MKRHFKGALGRFKRLNRVWISKIESYGCETDKSVFRVGKGIQHTYIHKYILIITGVQASGVIIDRLLRQCCFVWSEIVGPHSSGNFND